MLDIITSVRDGRVHENARERISDFLKSANGRNVRITIKPVKKQRSLNQNAYYWGVVIPCVVNMFADAGSLYEPDQVHLFLKQHVGALKMVITEPSGVARTVVKSSAGLSTKEFEDYMEAIRVWAAEFDYQIPLPNEGYFHDQDDRNT